MPLSPNLEVYITFSNKLIHIEKYVKQQQVKKTWFSLPLLSVLNNEACSKNSCKLSLVIFLQSKIKSIQDVANMLHIKVSADIFVHVCKKNTKQKMIYCKVQSLRIVSLPLFIKFMYSPYMP